MAQRRQGSRTFGAAVKMTRKKKVSAMIEKVLLKGLNAPVEKQENWSKTSFMII